MPEPRATTVLVSEVLTEVQEGGGMDRAVGKLHPESLEDADAITTSRADQKRRAIIHKSAASKPAQIGPEHTLRRWFEPTSGVVRCCARWTTESSAPAVRCGVIQSRCDAGHARSRRWRTLRAGRPPP